ncbi:hypothetical protein GCM10011386_39170 [Parapedobacter defluvii]|uniref:Uncharacterized protein n=1 Tax=Parapedobacter defluvii TaxID=2045106 RepID=A0ABQ1MM81_9SPHI|nr:hypothetical protein [Parapedobacter defluvii]GGC43065.1 hypothetical protein GCM10011386_39170 [Parapedobacter defluvii]
MLNGKIKQAIENAVQEEGQSPLLAMKIKAWMEALTEGDADIADPGSYTPRSSLCFENTIVPQNPEE